MFDFLRPFHSQIHEPAPTSHKGENGKVLIIGGSDLFSAASQWAFKVVSRVVDMTFYSSVAENNQILHDAKLYGQDGVIVRRSDLRSYLAEADSILIGPGMRRDAPSRFSPDALDLLEWNDLTNEDWENDTRAATSVILRNFPEKRFVIDAGALQVVRAGWLPRECVLTPHMGELRQFLENNPELVNATELQNVVEQLEASFTDDSVAENQPPVVQEGNFSEKTAYLQKIAQQLLGATFLLKGRSDFVWNSDQLVQVAGANAGMTKGGTGDVLAGLIAAFLAKSPALPSAVVASWLNKQAGYQLYEKVGSMYNTSDVVNEIPGIWGQL